MSQKDRSKAGGRPRSTSPRARLLVVCDDPQRLDAVVGKLGRLRVEPVTAPWLEYVGKLRADLAAVVLAEPLPVPAAAAVAAVRGHRDSEHVPLYVVASDKTPERQVRNIYASGATAVFGWPREARLLPDLLAETFGMAAVRGGAKRPDIALGRTIRAHLRLGPHPGSAIRVAARGGVVTLSGETHSLARKRKIIEATAAVPGVTKIHSAFLRVANLGVSDQSVEKDIRTVVQRMSEIDPKMLAVSVQNGRVELRGIVPKRDQFQHFLELIENIKGVRELRHDVEVASRRPADYRIRNRLHKAVAAVFPKERINIAVFKGVAVLDGHVSSLSTKRGIERLVSRDDAITRVVNKLQVSLR